MIVELLLKHDFSEMTSDLGFCWVYFYLPYHFINFNIFTKILTSPVSNLKFAKLPWRYLLHQKSHKSFYSQPI